jgi:hypothetical protein
MKAVKDENGEGSGRNSTGNGSSGNDSVHPNVQNNGNGSNDDAKAAKANNAVPLTECMARDGSSGGGCPKNTNAGGNNEENRSGGGSNEKNGSRGGSNEKNNGSGSGGGSNEKNNGSGNKEGKVVSATPDIPIPMSTGTKPAQGNNHPMFLAAHTRAMTTAIHALHSAGFSSLVAGQPTPAQIDAIMPSWQNIVSSTGLESMTGFHMSQVSNGNGVQPWGSVDQIPKPSVRARSIRKSNQMSGTVGRKRASSTDLRNASDEEGRSTPSRQKSNGSGRSGRKKSRPEQSNDF